MNPHLINFLIIVGAIITAEVILHLFGFRPGGSDLP